MVKTKIKNQDETTTFSRMLIAIIVLSAILLVVGILAVILVFVGIIGAVASEQAAIAIIAVAVAALLGIAAGGCAIAWVILIILCMVKADKVKGLEAKNFRIAFGVLLGVCATVIIVNFVFYFVDVPSQALEALSSLQSISLIAAIVVSAYFKVQINK